MNSSNDEELRALAVRRVTARRELLLHALVYVVVNVFLIGVWAITSHGSFWPIWVLFGWGIGLALHAAKVFVLDPGDNAVENEMRRMRGQR